MSKKLIGWKTKVRTPQCEAGVFYPTHDIGHKPFIFFALKSVQPQDYPDVFERVYEEEPESKKIIGWKTILNNPLCDVEDRIKKVHEKDDMVKILGVDFRPSDYPEIFEPIYEPKDLEVVMAYVNNLFDRTLSTTIQRVVSEKLLILIPDFAEKIKESKNG